MTKAANFAVIKQFSEKGKLPCNYVHGICSTMDEARHIATASGWIETTHNVWRPDKNKESYYTSDPDVEWSIIIEDRRCTILK